MTTAEESQFPISSVGISLLIIAASALIGLLVSYVDFLQGRVSIEKLPDSPAPIRALLGFDVSFGQIPGLVAESINEEKYIYYQDAPHALVPGEWTLIKTETNDYGESCSLLQLRRLRAAAGEISNCLSFDIPAYCGSTAVTALDSPMYIR